MKQGDGPQGPVLMGEQGQWIKAAFLRVHQSPQQQNPFFSQLLEQSDPGRTCSLAIDESSCLKKTTKPQKDPQMPSCTQNFPTIRSRNPVIVANG